MFRSLWLPFQKKVIVLFHTLQRQLKPWVKPLPPTVTVCAFTDLSRTKTDLILENALLRHPVAVLQRHVRRPRFTWKDRLSMVITASRLSTWRQALLIVQPDTVLRWHRDLFKHVWRRKSGQRGHHSPLNSEVVALIQQLASANDYGCGRYSG
jgi:putative transposase